MPTRTTRPAGATARIASAVARRVARALQEHVDRQARRRSRGRADVERLGGAESRASASRCGFTSVTATEAAPRARAACAATSPTGPAPVTSTRGPGADPRLAAGPEPDRQRLEQGGRVVAERVRDGVRELLVHGDQLGERPVDRRRRVEAHVRAEVVAAGQALARR